jgi:hypothetical protein
VVTGVRTCHRVRVQVRPGTASTDATIKVMLIKQVAMLTECDLVLFGIQRVASARWNCEIASVRLKTSNLLAAAFLLHTCTLKFICGAEVLLLISLPDLMHAVFKFDLITKRTEDTRCNRA